MNKNTKLSGFVTKSKQVAGKIANASRAGLHKGCRAVALGATVMAATVGSAKAENAGVTEIVTALNGLKPDLGTVVAAAIGIALISIGAVAAISLGKRIMGK